MQTDASWQLHHWAPCEASVLMRAANITSIGMVALG